VLLSTAAFILAFQAVGLERSLTNPHHGIGVALYTLVLIQAIGGSVIHRWEKNKERFKIPLKLMVSTCTLYFLVMANRYRYINGWDDSLLFWALYRSRLASLCTVHHASFSFSMLYGHSRCWSYTLSSLTSISLKWHSMIARLISPTGLEALAVGEADEARVTGLELSQQLEQPAQA
jgi:hypothetical protein